MRRIMMVRAYVPVIIEGGWDDEQEMTDIESIVTDGGHAIDVTELSVDELDQIDDQFRPTEVDDGQS